MYPNLLGTIQLLSAITSEKQITDQMSTSFCKSSAQKLLQTHSILPQLSLTEEAINKPLSTPANKQLEPTSKATWMRRPL